MIFNSYAFLAFFPIVTLALTSTTLTASEPVGPVMLMSLSPIDDLSIAESSE